MRGFKEFLNEESANGVVEVILILVVLIGAVVIFRTQLQKLVTDLMTTVTSKAKARAMPSIAIRSLAVLWIW